MSNTNTSSSVSQPSNPKPNKLLLFVISIVCFIVLAAIIYWSGQRAASESTERDALVIQQAKVEVISLQLESTYTRSRTVYGQLDSIQQSNIGFELNGMLQHIDVAEGSLVKANQLLARLDTTRLHARKNELTSSLNSAKANAKLAQLSMVRIKQLVETKLEPQQRLDEAQAQLDASNAAVTEVAARLDSLKVEMAKSELRAPFDGQVVQQYLDSGTVVSAGQPVFSIITSNALEARFGLPEQTAFGLSIGQTVDLHAGEQSMPSVVQSIAKARNMSTRTVDVVFALDSNLFSNPESLGALVSGDLISLNVDIPVTKTGAWVPVSALASGVRGLWTLYVVDQQQTIQTRLVSIDFAEAERAFVSGAIKQGDKVIVSGIHRLVPQQQVKNVVDVDNVWTRTNYSATRD